MDKYVSDQPATNAKRHLRIRYDGWSKTFLNSANDYLPIYDFTKGEAEILIFLCMRTQYLSLDMYNMFMLAIQSNLERQVKILLNIFLLMIYLMTLLVY
jgi:hypothetical protein